MSEDAKHKEIMDAIANSAKVQNDWNKAHEALDTDRFKKVLSEEQLEDLVEKSMIKAIRSTGKWTYQAIIATSVVLVAVGIIFGGFKFLVAFFATLFGFKKI